MTKKHQKASSEVMKNTSKVSKTPSKDSKIPEKGNFEKSSINTLNQLEKEVSHKKRTNDILEEVLKTLQEINKRSAHTEELLRIAPVESKIIVTDSHSTLVSIFLYKLKFY